MEFGSQKKQPAAKPGKPKVEAKPASKPAGGVDEKAAAPAGPSFFHNHPWMRAMRAEASGVASSWRPTSTEAMLDARADRAAERALAGSPDRAHAEPSAADAMGAQAPLDPRVQATLRQPGAPLPPPERSAMEEGFGRDLSGIRIHTDGQANQAARSVGARAFTFGHHIVFGRGHYAPGAPAGQRLLAHELAHTLQQPAGRPEVLQRDGEDQGVLFHFSVQVSTPMDSDLLLLEFIKQYRGVSSNAEAEEVREREHWEWEGPPPVVTAEDARRGYFLLPVHDLSIAPGTEEEQRGRQTYFGGLPEEDQQALNAETDRQFWERTQYRVGQRLGTSADDQSMAEFWRVLRGDLVRQRQAIDALPEHLRDFLFDPEARRVLEPRDYAQVLHIAEMIARLNEAELAEYSSRTTSETSDWGRFEDSLARFIHERELRQAAAMDREALRTRLWGMDEVYRAYRLWDLNRTLTEQRDAYMQERGVGGDPGGLADVEIEKMELESQLRRHGFADVDDFETTIDGFEEAFRDEAVAIATVMLDQYEHILFEQERRYQEDPTLAATLHEQLAPARALFEEADRAGDEESDYEGGLFMGPEESADSGEYEAQMQDSLEQGDREVRSLAGEHPLLEYENFPREELARAPAEGVERRVLEYIRQARADVQETRTNLESNPDLVFELDVLVQATYRSEGIEPGSIYDTIIQSHIFDTHLEHLVSGVILAVIAIVAGLMSGGTGAVAVLGAGTAFGIGAYQVMDEYRRYEEQSAAYGAQLLSDDPTIAWLIVAIVGAGLDLAAVGAAVRSVRPAVDAFNETGDLVALEARLAKLQEAGEINDAVRRSVFRAAEAEAQSRAAWQSFRSGLGELAGTASMGVDPSHFGRLLYAIYSSLKHSVRRFEVWVRSRQAIDLFGDVNRLTPEELARAKALFQQAITEWDEMVRHGRTLGMGDDEIELFMRMRGERPAMTLDEVLREMSTWQAVRTRRVVMTGLDPEFSAPDLLRQYSPETTTFSGAYNPTTDTFVALPSEGAQCADGTSVADALLVARRGGHRDVEALLMAHTRAADDTQNVGFTLTKVDDSTVRIGWISGQINGRNFPHVGDRLPPLDVRPPVIHAVEATGLRVIE